MVLIDTTSRYNPGGNSEASFPKFVLRNSEAFSFKPCLIDRSSGEKLSFDDVRDMAYNVSWNLVKHFYLQKGDVFAMVLGDHLEQVPVILGVMAAGGIFTGASCVSTDKEIGTQFSACQAKFLLTQASIYPRIKSACDQGYMTSLRFIFIVDPEQLPKKDVSTIPLRQITKGDHHEFVDARLEQEDTCFLPFSFGRTGKCMGIMHTHGSMKASLEHETSFHPTPRDIMLCPRPSYEDFGFMMLFNSIANGSRVIMMHTFEEKAYIEALRLRSRKVTLTYLVPTMLHTVLRVLKNENIDLPFIRGICYAGMIERQTFDEIRTKLPNLEVFCKIYGRSEFGLITSTPKTHLDSVDLDTVGTLHPGQKLKIISADDTNKELGVDETGELLIYTPRQVMKGYINETEESQKVIDSDGWLHTGDIGYVDAKGFLYITDRLKDIVMYKSLQIAPSELEAEILRIPNVSQVAVTGVPDENPENGDLVTAFVVLNEKSNETTEIAATIEAAVAKRFAQHKHLRGGVVFLENLPDTSSRKRSQKEIINM